MYICANVQCQTAAQQVRTTFLFCLNNRNNNSRAGCREFECKQELLFIIRSYALCLVYGKYATRSCSQGCHFYYLRGDCFLRQRNIPLMACEQNERMTESSLGAYKTNKEIYFHNHLHRRNCYCLQHKTVRFHFSRQACQL